jgi:hypothetical protein
VKVSSDKRTLGWVRMNLEISLGTSWRGMSFGNGGLVDF